MIIAFVVILFEMIVIIGIDQISYKNMERIMADNLDYAISSIRLRTESLDSVDIHDPRFRHFFDSDNAQVQIINDKGYVIFDSLGVLYTEKIIYPDITLAKEGTRGTWRGRVDYSDEQVMAMSAPIFNSTNQYIGTLRMVIGLSSLQAMQIKSVAIFISLGVFIVMVSLLMSNYFAKSFVKPLNNLKEVSEKIADGQFSIRSDIKTGDEIEHLSNSINYMAEELIKRDQLKNDFISSVSHELRTPLTSIKGWAITIQGGDNIDKKIVNEGLDIIVSEADRLSDMVEELLDFSRFTSGRVTLNKEQINVDDFLENIINQMKPRILGDDLVFVIDFADDLGDMVVDPDRMKQVFINVLDNAIKFTDSPGMISLGARKNALNELVFFVTDTGAGIPEDQINRVKEKFFKGNLGKSHTGLGLSISDEIINLHNGDLRIESQVGKGTTITIVVPSGLKEMSKWKKDFYA